MQDVYENIDDYSLGKIQKILIVFDDMIADMINNKNLNLIVAELFITGIKLNMSIAFITQPYFTVSKYILSALLFHDNSSQKRASGNCN